MTDHLPDDDKLDSLVVRIKRLLSGCYQSEFLTKLQLVKLKHNRNFPVLIYQMGKVGSQTLYVSLKSLNLPNPIYHLHFLSEAKLCTVEKDIKRLQQETTSSSFINRLRGQVVHHHYLTSLALQKRLATKKDNEILIISLVRDPIARRISGFFETMWMFHPELIDNSGNVREYEVRQELTKLLTAEADQIDRLDWFDQEIKTVFDIDVYAYPFNRHTGYTIINPGSVKLLVLTLERLAQNIEIIGQFLSYKEKIELVNSNLGTNKKSAATYQQITQTLKFPVHICEKFYNSRMACHFYDSYTRKTFLERWSQQ